MSLLTPLLWLLMILPLVLLAIFKSRQNQLRYLFFFVLYFLADCYLQQGAHLFLKPVFPGLKFAWPGKVLSLALSLVIIFCVSKRERQQIGFTTAVRKPRQLRFGFLFFLGCLLFDLVFKLILFPRGGQFQAEAFAFQATMPGLTEELAFRGISLWLLNKAFPARWSFRGVPLGWGFVIVTLLFGIAHGAILTTHYEFRFDLVTMVYLVIVSSLSLGILRIFSGNLLYPVLGHNAINLMNALIRIL